MVPISGTFVAADCCHGGITNFGGGYLGRKRPNNTLFIYMHFNLNLTDGKLLFGLMQNAHIRNL